MLNPKELARAGYVKFDLDTGLAGNGKTLCLVSDDEKYLLQELRKKTPPGHHSIHIVVDGHEALTMSTNVLDRLQR